MYKGEETVKDASKNDLLGGAQNLHRFFFGVKFVTNAKLALFKKPFERDAFRFNPFDTFRETTSKQARNSSPGTLC